FQLGNAVLGERNQFCIDTERESPDATRQGRACKALGISASTGRPRSKQESATSSCRVARTYLRFTEGLQYVDASMGRSIHDRGSTTQQAPCVVIGELFNRLLSCSARVFDRAARVGVHGCLEIVMGNLSEALASLDVIGQLKRLANRAVEGDASPRRQRFV